MKLRLGSINAADLSTETALLKALLGLLPASERTNDILSIISDAASRKNGCETLLALGAVAALKNIGTKLSASILQKLHDSKSYTFKKTTCPQVTYKPAVSEISYCSKSRSVAIDLEAYVSVPSYLKIFEPIYFSSIDEELIEAFYLQISGPILTSLEDKLFDIICVDVGSQVFLQNGRLFKVISFVKPATFIWSLQQQHRPI